MTRRTARRGFPLGWRSGFVAEPSMPSGERALAHEDDHIAECRGREENEPKTCGEAPTTEQAVVRDEQRRAGYSEPKRPASDELVPLNDCS